MKNKAQAHDLEQEEFYGRRVTQSDYRGGALKGPREGDGRLKTELKELPLTTQKQKDVLRDHIRLKAEIMIEGLIPENRQDSVREGAYLDDIFKGLGV
jgi:hypothetical protein